MSFFACALRWYYCPPIPVLCPTVIILNTHISDNICAPKRLQRSLISNFRSYCKFIFKHSENFTWLSSSIYRSIFLRFFASHNILLFHNFFPVYFPLSVSTVWRTCLVNCEAKDCLRVYLITEIRCVLAARKVAIS